MNKTLWYGIKNNDVRFADNQAALISEGINDAKSFTVNGDVSGLNLVGETGQQTQSHNPQTAG